MGTRPSFYSWHGGLEISLYFFHRHIQMAFILFPFHLDGVLVGAGMAERSGTVHDLSRFLYFYPFGNAFLHVLFLGYLGDEAPAALSWFHSYLM